MSDTVLLSMAASHKHGYLGLYVGPMFAGKTTKLIATYNAAIKSNLSSLVITHSSEIRYSIDQLSTHDQTKISCFKFDSIGELINSLGDKLSQYDIVLIDEAQFFPDLHKVLYLIDTLHKTVHVFGLDGDFKRNKFGQILDLIPHCDSVEKLSAICVTCKQPAIFSCRTTNNTDQVLVGSDDLYQSLCRTCYNLQGGRFIIFKNDLN
jgi:thymidine kinase